jgi:hypothetical protein
MRAVYKYRLDIADGIQIISLPKEAELLHIGPSNSRNELFLWALTNHDLTAPLLPRQFIVLGTGEVTKEIELQYIGTAIVDTYVWHVFEVLKSKSIQKCKKGEYIECEVCISQG